MAHKAHTINGLINYSDCFKRVGWSQSYSL
jgi:hypothetical protein